MGNHSAVIPEKVAERAATKYTAGPDGCWLSTYSIASHGYAQIGWQEQGQRYGVTAHRAAWVHANRQQVPHWGRITQVCRASQCVNPAHLQLVGVSPEERECRAKRKPTLTPEERFWANVDKGAPGDCWTWTRYVDKEGYGRTNFEGRTQIVHRVAYQIANGPIPPSMYVDHACFTRSCANPDHLRLADRYQSAQYHKGANSSNANSGVRGVHKNGNKFVVRMNVNGKARYFGTFGSAAEAELVAEAKRAELYDFYRNSHSASPFTTRA